ncbi:hypothetical protein GCM10011507_32010 [Edaphobacter acidisoli]|uniref:DUF374 domain-containing protein n=1 Tax=Edaphobacter acidisoli TaxID=2040573 RepID=A0A916S0U2_9BACT|nr:lysophospholipid acyltransferase family protein [Edaphobacter acidisoli]GGA78394.1 hypothetical protein GCM10011507_32010 [Edaphobacter acidisoli]
MPQTFTPKQRLALAIVPRVASFVIRCLGMTLRYRDVCHPGPFPGYDTPPPGVFAFWHSCLLTCAWRFRNRKVAVLISQSYDGELIARTVERLGFIAIRGSSSRDGSVGLRNLQRAYLEGHFCAITADGPRGPAEIAKPGVTQLGKLVNSNIITFHAHPDRAWQLRSWDQFLIPKPFSRVTIGWILDVPAEQPAVQSALNQAVKLSRQK